MVARPLGGAGYSTGRGGAGNVHPQGESETKVTEGRKETTTLGFAYADFVYKLKVGIS